MNGSLLRLIQGSFTGIYGSFSKPELGDGEGGVGGAVTALQTGQEGDDAVGFALEDARACRRLIRGLGLIAGHLGG